EVAERDAERDGDHQRGDRQLDGGGQGPPDLLEHRLTRDRGRAEVTRRDPPEEAAVLHPEGLVEPQHPVQLGDVLGRRAIAEERRRRAAWQRPEPGEDHDRQQQERRDHLQQAPHHEAQHRPPSDDRDAESGTALAGGATRSSSQSTLTVRNRSSVRGDGMSPFTPCLTTIAGGELDSGTPGSCSMITRLTSRYAAACSSSPTVASALRMPSMIAESSGSVSPNSGPGAPKKLPREFPASL